MSSLSLDWTFRLALRRPRPARTHRTGPGSRGLKLEQLETRTLLSGTWDTLTNPAPSGTGTMMLLSDGSPRIGTT